jgi:hypothetical protein
MELAQVMVVLVLVEMLIQELFTPLELQLKEAQAERQVMAIRVELLKRMGHPLTFNLLAVAVERVR